MGVFRDGARARAPRRLEDATRTPMPPRSYALSAVGIISALGLLAASPWLLDASGFMPRRLCGPAFTPALAVGYAGANLAIAVAYAAISTLLLRARGWALSRVGAEGERSVKLFALFIALCGAGHAADTLMLVLPMYRALVVWHAATALVSVYVAVLLPGLMAAVLCFVEEQDATLARSAVSAQREARRFRAALQAIEGGVYEVDREGVITLSEGRGLSALGFHPGELVGRRLADFVDEATLPTMLAVTRGEREHATTESILNGRAYVARGRATPDGSLWTWEDVTDARAELARARLDARLDRLS